MLMTHVKDLIAELSQLNPDKEVYLSCSDPEGPFREFAGVRSFLDCVVLRAGSIREGVGFNVVIHPK